MAFLTSFLADGILTAPPASAGTTSFSTFTKSATDLTTGSVATESTPGTANPGDTLKYVLSYTNNTGSAADATVTDPITGNQTFVPHSLQTPPNTTGEWSTNGGTSYVTTEPASGVNAVGAQITPTVNGSTGLQATFSAPSSIDAGAASGDGFNLVYYGGDVYNVIHRIMPGGNYAAELDCHIIQTGARCGAPFQNGTNVGAYVSDVAGTALTTGIAGATQAQMEAAEPLWTAGYNWATVDQSNGYLYYAATQAEAGTPSGKFGTACVDLITWRSCGFTALGEDTTSGIDLPVISGGVAMNGNFWVIDYAGQLFCTQMATNTACPGDGPAVTTGIKTFPTYVPSTAAAQGATHELTEVTAYDNRYLFTKIAASTSGSQYVSCYDTQLAELCPNWTTYNTGNPPTTAVSTAQSTLQNNVILPILSTAGAVTGICTEAVTSNGNANGPPLYCITLSTGAHLATSPYPSETGAADFSISARGVGGPAIIGTKVYVPYYSGNYASGNSTSTYQCFDFSDVVSGVAQPCSGYTAASTTGTYGSTSDIRPYAITQLPGEDCLGEDGDNGQFQFFSGSTGALGCTQASATVSITPGSFYCSGASGLVSGWSNIALSGVTSSQFSGSDVTITDANGNPVPGWTDKFFPNTQSTFNISSIPYSGTTTTLNVTVELLDPAAGISPSPSFSVNFTGAPVQICYETTVNNNCYATGTAVSNVANVVTTVISNSDTDGPAGNTTGTVTFNVGAGTASQCDLTINKSVSESPAFPGDTVTYTVTVTNSGTASFTATNPAQISDSLSGILGDATYVGGSATASTGTVNYTAPLLTWSGALASGAAATIAYQVTVNSPDTGPGMMTNTALVPSGVTGTSNCPAGGSDAAACSTSTLIGQLKITKAVSGTPTPGNTLTYTVTVHNAGTAAYTGNAQFSDSLAGFIPSNATFGTVTTTAGFPAATYTAGTETVAWADTGTFAAGATVTVTYTVVIANPDNGSHQLNNTVVSTTPGSNCPSGSTDPRCSTSTAVTYNLTVTKTASPTVAAIGTTVVYTITVKNTGPGTLTNPSITDPLTNIVPSYAPSGNVTAVTSSAGTAAYSSVTNEVTWSNTSIASGATVTITYDVKVATLGASPYVMTNTVTTPATLGSTCPTGGTLAASCTASVPVYSLAFTKTTSEIQATPGDTLTYTVKVVNSGAGYTATTPATFTDSLANVLPGASYVSGSATASAGTVAYTVGTGITWTDTSLGVGTTTTITYQVQVDQFGAISHTLSNTVVSTSPGTNCASGSGAAACSTSTAVSGLVLSKSASPSAYTAVGTTITFTYVLTNVGEIALTSIGINDTLSGLSAINCGGVTTLAIGAQLTCTATYVTTNADLARGSVTNVATGTGTFTGASGPTTSNVGSATVPLAGLQLTKSSTLSSFNAPDQVIPFSFVINNLGASTATGVSVNDALSGLSAIDCPSTSIPAVGAETCTATYTTTQADVDTGSVTNTATASGTIVGVAVDLGHVDGHGARDPEPVAHGDQVGHLERPLQHGGPGHHLPVRGQEHRQRHADLGGHHRQPRRPGRRAHHRADVHRADRALGQLHHLEHHHAGAGPVGHLHRHLRHHLERPRHRLGL